LNTRQHHRNFDLAPIDNRRLASLCGKFDEHLRQIEDQLEVEIHNRGHHFQVKGTPQAVVIATKIINDLYLETQQKDLITPGIVHLFIQQAKANHTMPEITKQNATENETIIHCHRGSIKPHSLNQQLYVKNILQHDISFGVGPAGTGKTYLAVACAVAALEQEQVSRILLVRPAVEAGEKLGFLPGDFAQKVDPYFRPLYDALYEMMGFDPVIKLLEQHVIEVAPLAYMRGRTLNDAFVILDEGQNTTKEQMKMFLTRIGFNSKAVITGDITQTDLPKGSESGLRHCLEVLKDVKGLSFTYFQASDVVRHPLVQGILEAYDKHENNNK
jgi:phosphate starvation-inducible PhoH-like protein